MGLPNCPEWPVSASIHKPAWKCMGTITKNVKSVNDSDLVMNLRANTNKPGVFVCLFVWFLISKSPS